MVATQMNEQQRGALQQAVLNAVVSRRELWSRILMDGEGRDIDTDCGYPSTISPQAYHDMYEREGVASRVVDVWPEESWSSRLRVFEDEDPEVTTPFEERWEELFDEFRIEHYLSRIDRLSGIGRFGILLLGIDDGNELDSEVEGMGELGKPTPQSGSLRDLLYLRPFDESAVSIPTFDKDPKSSRFSQPVFYNISFQDEEGNYFSAKVHWHRVIHVADQREMSDVYGAPRMKKVYNRLMDIRKILSGSGEMFWKGAFPGYSFEVDEDSDGVTLDEESLREEMENYMNGLQRYLALTGVSAKSLATQVADPRGHLESQMDAIALSLGIPKRILYGSEQAQLASSQDAKTWARRLKRRQTGYITPMIVRPFIDRLIAARVLPFVENYCVEWDDIDTQTDQEKANVAKGWAETLSKYVAGGVEEIVPADEFLSIFAGLDQKQIQQIDEALDALIAEEESLTPEVPEQMPPEENPEEVEQ